MAKWVELKDLLEHPEKYGVENPMELEIAYVPDRRSVTLAPSMTGYEKKQTFHAETERHKYYSALCNGKLYLASNKTAEQRVYLRGKQGYDNGPEALRTHAEIYGNDELCAKGVTWSEETIKLLETLPSFLKEIREMYWTSIQWSNPFYFGLKVVYSSGVGYYYLYCYLSGSAGSDTYGLAVRPLVSLPSNILVDISAIGKEPLKLALPKQVEEVSTFEEKQETATQNELIAELRTTIATMKDLSEKAENLLKQIETLT